MDLGMLGFDDLVVGSAPSSSPSLVSHPETKQKLHGSGFLNQERPTAAGPGGCTEQEDWRCSSKVAKTDVYHSFSGSKAMQNRSPLLRSNTTLFSDGQQMLSFSSPNSEETITLSNYYQQPTSNPYSRNSNTGYDMSGVYTGVRGLFTPSQWMELEHQALIYKYLSANVPIPSNLLIPIRKALDSAGYSCFSGGGLLVPNSLGWGTFRLGYSNSTDPEPGRCRRTDGKKWRCSRDAVADQKYCERHMNRGRHRSRKPVEGGQTGHSVAGSTTAKFMPMATSASASVVPGSGSTTNGLGLSHHSQLKNLQQPGATNTSASFPNRNFLNKENAENRIQEGQFSIPKNPSPYEESPRDEFGCVYSDSLLNPLQKSSDSITESQHSVHHFIDDWPKNPTDRSSISWPTQLSISIPMTASDFTSSTSSPINGKTALSPLRLSRDHETKSTQMGLGVGSFGNDQNQRQANWIPISWETSMGGPLGEVLHRTNSGVGDQKSTSALNLMTDGWDHSPRLGSSPTGVLQKMAFGSVSNSSAGSSPRPENHLSSN